MDTDSNELVKIALEVVLAPVTDIAENALGILGGDWLHEQRARNRAKLRSRTAEVLRERNIRIEEPLSPSVAIPLLSAAQDESRDDLLSLWAALIAAAMDPERRRAYRREFVGIVKNLEPLDAAVLPLLDTEAAMRPSRREFIAAKLGASPQAVELSFRNLRRLELADSSSAAPTQHPFLTPLGRELLKIVS